MSIYILFVERSPTCRTKSSVSTVSTETDLQPEEDKILASLLLEIKISCLGPKENLAISDCRVPILLFDPGYILLQICFLSKTAPHTKFHF